MHGGRKHRWLMGRRGMGLGSVERSGGDEIAWGRKQSRAAAIDKRSNFLSKLS